MFDNCEAEKILSKKIDCSPDPGGRTLLDVTATATTPRITGIQRLVRDAVRELDGVTLVVFSTKFSGYVEIPAIPNVVSKRDDDLSQKGFHYVRVAAEILWAWLRRTILRYLPEKIEAMIIEKIRRAAVTLSGTLTIDQGILTNAEPLEPSLGSSDRLWLMDIPQSRAHLQFLKAIAEKIHFGMYVYDTIPLDSPELMDEDAPERLRKAYWEYVMLATHSDKLLCLSSYSATSLKKNLDERGIKAPQISILYPPAPRSRAISPVGTETGFLRRVRQFVSDSEIVVLAIGPLNRRKNLKVIYKAVWSLIGSGLNVKFLHLEPRVSSVDASARRLQKEMLRKFPSNFQVFQNISEENLAGLYRLCDVVAVPSLVEGFGLPIIEASLFGKPTLVSDIPIFREIGQFLHINYVSSDDPNAWARELVRVSEKKLKFLAADFSFLSSPADLMKQLSD